MSEHSGDKSKEENKGFTASFTSIIHEAWIDEEHGEGKKKKRKIKMW